MRAFDVDDNIGAIVLTGSEKAFAAGADIGAMQGWSYMDVYKQDYLGGNWESLKRIRKPVIAAVAGYALGGGCERSEEHTSELQSLMRISYAVFCLNKKRQN